MVDWALKINYLSIYLTLIYLFIEGLYSTGSPQGFSQVQISHKLNVIQNMHITVHKRKIYKHHPKVSLFGIAVVKNVQFIKLGDAGTIDHFGLAFQYQIKK